MNFTFDISGLDKIVNASSVIKNAIESELRKAVYKGGLLVETTAKKSITEGGKTGNVYKRGNITHQASASGQSPANDTGRLLNSINTELKQGAEVNIIAGKGVVNYAKSLEFGTKNMEARPFMFPAFEKSKNKITDLLKSTVRGAIK
jgi:HK97 gp10 family phage protein